MTRETAPKGGSPILPARTTKAQDTSDLDQARALLDSPPDVLARLWQKVDALAKHRAIDPELRRDILRVANRIAPELAEEIEGELDIATPAAVLEAHPELIVDRPALGAFPSADNITAPSIEDWFREDPRRLRAYVLEAYRFGSDEKIVVQSVLEFAYKLGIDLALAKDIVTHALIDARARHDEAVAR
jgi:hypothetical protein